ncbi:MAG: NRDE family protein [Chromatiales bacterium]|nr:MAG: NRDE family protein [Chromatiales bacterium]
MCLIALSIRQHPDYPLILAANRDEFHARPTKEAHWWPDKPDIVGGRDLQAGGTWLALHRDGRFATVTNFRDAEPPKAGHRSRGHLVTGFLESDLTPADYLDTIDEQSYAGFNLIVGTLSDVAYLSNREQGKRQLDATTYGLSNALLDGPWHKVERSKEKLSSMIADGDVDETSLMRLMNDRNKAPVAEVETGRLDFEKAHAITAPFIVMPDYGTRCSSIVLADKEGNWRFVERRFDPAGRQTGESKFSFS